MIALVFAFSISVFKMYLPVFIDCNNGNNSQNYTLCTHCLANGVLLLANGIC